MTAPTDWHKGKTVWAEDEMTLRDPDAERIEGAWRRLFGEDMPDTSQSLAEYDGGDALATLYPHGRVAWSTYIGSAISMAPTQPKPPTDLEAFTALWDDIPGTPDEWNALALRADKLKAKTQNVRAKNHGGAPRPDGGDGTINAELWGHLRNVTRALKEMAWTLSSAERGDDPDIPF